MRDVTERRRPVKARPGLTVSEPVELVGPVTFSELEETLAEHRLLLAAPASPEDSTLVPYTVARDENGC